MFQNIITEGKKWHHLAVKTLSVLFSGIKSNHIRDFYCLNCFHSFRTKNKLKKHENVCKNHDHFYVEKPKEDNKILKFKSLFNKICACHNNPEKSSTTKHTSSGYSLFAHCSFDNTKNKLHYYRGEDCMKKFCKDLKKHATKIINYEKKEMIPLTIEKSKSYHDQKLCYICKKKKKLYWWWQ